MSWMQGVALPGHATLPHLPPPGMALQAHYVNLCTDFGFKKIFGEPARKELLISFFNTLLPPQTSHPGTPLQQAITALHAKGFDAKFIATTLNLPLAFVQAVLAGLS